MRRYAGLIAAILMLMLSGCSSDDTHQSDEATELSVGIEPCVSLQSVRRLVNQEQAILQLDTNLKEEVDLSGFASRYCTYTNRTVTPNREVLSITTYRERRGHEAFDAVSRIYDKQIPGSIRPLNHLLPALKAATAANVIESKEKGSAGVLINIKGGTYTIMLPYSLANATEKAQRVVAALLMPHEAVTAA